MSAFEKLVNAITVGGFLTFGLAATGYALNRMAESNADPMMMIAVLGFALFVLGLAAAKLLSRLS